MVTIQTHRCLSIRPAQQLLSSLYPILRQPNDNPLLSLPVCTPVCRACTPAAATPAACWAALCWTPAPAAAACWAPAGWRPAACAAAAAAPVVVATTPVVLAITVTTTPVFVVGGGAAGQHVLSLLLANRQRAAPGTHNAKSHTPQLHLPVILPVAPVVVPLPVTSAHDNAQHTQTHII